MYALLRPTLVLLVLLAAINGVAYPLLITGIAQMLFPTQAAGSLIARGNTFIGSRLIGQRFTDRKYFWGRPSATMPQPYNALAPGGSNQGPLNPALFEAVPARIRALRAADPGNTARVPIDLVTASASGLDPDISIAAALYQAPRVARVRGLPPERVRALIDRQAQRKWLGLLGEPHVNVLELNLALDEIE